MPKDLRQKYRAPETCFGKLCEQELADWLWNKIQKFIPDPVVKGRKPVGVNPNIRIVKYTKGHKFGPHVDYSESFKTMQSALTFMVYLNSAEEGAFAGGETNFLDPQTEQVVHKVIPKSGMGIAFLQDDQRLLHEGAEVTQSKIGKYIMRTDIMFEKGPGDDITNEMMEEL